MSILFLGNGSVYVGYIADVSEIPILKYKRPLATYTSTVRWELRLIRLTIGSSDFCRDQ
jgi:hypothetical protein